MFLLHSSLDLSGFEFQNRTLVSTVQPAAAKASDNTSSRAHVGANLPSSFCPSRKWLPGVAHLSWRFSPFNTEHTIT
eukprot:4820579-Amphidinium_carterae.1